MNFFILMGHLINWKVSLLKNINFKDEQKMAMCINLPFSTLQELIRAVHQITVLAVGRQLERHHMPSRGQFRTEFQ